MPVYYYVDSDFILNPEDITLTADMGTICLASKRYPDLTQELDVSVIDGRIDESLLSDTITLEAENADVYKDDVLLTYEQLQTLPDGEKPFLSTAGTSPSGQDCSGGACLRSFNDNNMKVDFTIVTSQAVTVNVDTLICLRPSADVFSNFFKVTVNGVDYDDLGVQEIPAGSGYYTPHVMETVQMELQKGVNHVVFQSGPQVSGKSPCNLDALKISTGNEELKVIGGEDVIVVDEQEEQL